MTELTFAQRLKMIMEQKNLTPVSLAKKAGVNRQAISYIIQQNLQTSSLADSLAMALEVSENWLINGLKDDSFVHAYTMEVYSEVLLLIHFLQTGEVYGQHPKTLTHNDVLAESSFVFNPSKTNIFYYCSTKTDIISEKYLILNLEKQSYLVKDCKTNDKYCYPIVEIKTKFI